MIPDRVKEVAWRGFFEASAVAVVVKGLFQASWHTTAVVLFLYGWSVASLHSWDHDLLDAYRDEWPEYMPRPEVER